MIKETIEKNAEVKVNSKEMEVLQKHFPSCFDKDGKFDIKVFEELIKTEDIDIKKEGYSLDFLGKSYARYLASLDSETVIVPDEGNKDINSENVYIVGDNLDALQHLKYSYSERIKCIYIDPPYNTGSDGFVYNDKFEFTAEELAKKIGIEQEEAERVLNLQGKSTHSAWLTFMYPRLELARELLKNDGVIIISIDENEQANCKLLCDLVFGESNCLANLVWRKKYTGGKGSSTFADYHEYILVYARDVSSLDDISMARPDSEKEKFIYEDEWVEERGKYYTRPLKSNLDPRPTLVYPIELPDGTTVTTQWICAEDTYKQLKLEGRIEFKSSKTSQWPVYKKFYEFDDGGCVKIPSFIEVSNNNEAKKELKDLFNIYQTRDLPFQTPKPTKLLRLFIDNFTGDKDIVLDFFSGSGSTADAVMQSSIERKIKLTYIAVQLDEDLDKEYEHSSGSDKKKVEKAIEFLDSVHRKHTIDQIGLERIVRAAQKLAEENPEKAESLDLGFKTYYLKSTDKQTLDKIVDFDPNMPLDAEDIKAKFGKDTIIETWKIKDGYGFNAEVKEIDLKDYTAYFLTDSKVGTSLYLIDDMPENAIVELVRRIEAYELNVDRIIEYGYAFSHATNTALRSNLKTLKNRNAIEPIIRY